MKKARTVDIDTTSPIPYGEAVLLLDHAFNSGVWYATNTGKSSGQIRKKLLDKGYPNHPIQTITVSGEISTIDFIEETLSHLQESGILDDFTKARSFAKLKIASGVSLQRVSLLLRVKLFPEPIIEKVVQEFQEDDSIHEGLVRAAERIVNTSSFQKLDSFKQRQKLIRGLMSKGSSYGDIADIVDEYCS